MGDVKKFPDARRNRIPVNLPDIENVVPGRPEPLDDNARTNVDGDVTPFRRPPDAINASAALFLRTGDPVAREAAVAAWRARYQSVTAPFAETVPMPVVKDSLTTAEREANDA